MGVAGRPHMPTSERWLFVLDVVGGTWIRLRLSEGPPMTCVARGHEGVRPETYAVLRGSTGSWRPARPPASRPHWVPGWPAPSMSSTPPATSATIPQLRTRRQTKARGHFPGDDAVVKLLWLAIINIEDKRARERAARRQESGKSSDQPARLIEGQRVMGWREAPQRARRRLPRTNQVKRKSART